MCRRKRWLSGSGSGGSGNQWDMVGSNVKRYERAGSVGKRWEALGNGGKRWETVGSVGERCETVGTMGSDGKRWETGETVGSGGKHWETCGGGERGGEGGGGHATQGSSHAAGVGCTVIVRVVYRGVDGVAEVYGKKQVRASMGKSMYEQKQGGFAACNVGEKASMGK
eukprot:363696-Chlamydomonas_euryale.AAC.12